MKTKCIHTLKKDFKIIQEFPLILPNSKNEILCYIEKPTVDLPVHEFNEAMVDVFNILDEAFIKVGANIKFKRTTKREESHYQICWKNPGDPGLPYQFGDNTLAYATSFKQIYVNELFNWIKGFKEGYFDIVSTIVHEILHLLKLDHTDAIGDVMNAYYGNTKITQDSINGLKVIYQSYIKNIDITSDLINTLIGFLDAGSYITEKEIIELSTKYDIGLDKKLSKKENKNIFKDFLESLL